MLILLIILKTIEVLLTNLFASHTFIFLSFVLFSVHGILLQMTLIYPFLLFSAVEKVRLMLYADVKK